ncbi:MAG: hypothetical protein SOV20_05975, partial [Coriobacteriales bacterium]|nr:hypothetical protein [Coriobacteriales bacterium]
RVHGRRACAAFYFAEVLRGNASLLREGFLGEPQGLPALLDVGSNYTPVIHTHLVLLETMVAIFIESHKNCQHLYI